MSANCVSYFPCRIKVTSIKGKCQVYKNVGEEYTLEDFDPKGLCLLSFHSIYPYTLTYSQGGKFDWFKEGEFVIAQCPNPKIAISFEIQKTSDPKKISITAVKAKGECPQKMKVGDKFIIDFGKSHKLCYKALNSIIPFLSIKRHGKNIPNQNNNEILLRCPSHTNNVKFKIIY